MPEAQEVWTYDIALASVMKPPGPEIQSITRPLLAPRPGRGKRLSQNSERRLNCATIGSCGFFVALTPTLSQREREPSGTALGVPSPFGRGQGEGHSCYHSVSSMSFETAFGNVRASQSVHVSAWSVHFERDYSSLPHNSLISACVMLILLAP